MVWFFERASELIVYEIRRDNGSAGYESEMAAPGGPPITRRFSSASELIDAYLLDQTRLRAQGWRPRTGDIAALD